MSFGINDTYQKLARLLVAPTIEPSQRAARIQSVEKDIILPLRVLVLAILGYFFFLSGWEDVPGKPRDIGHSWIQIFFWFYLAVNLGAGASFVWMEQMTLRTTQWLIFTVGFLDVILMMGLTFLTNGWDSPFYWIFAVLILHNALAIPLAFPQILLNFLSIGGFIIGSLLDHKLIAVDDIDPRNESGYERVVVLFIWAACCYGIQVLFERQRRAEAEATEFAVRQERLRTAGRLAAEIAHKIKNPLGIITNAAFCLQRAVDEGQYAVEEQIGIIREEVEKADEILTELMGYAQLAEGRVERLDLAQELDDAILQVFPTGSKYDVTIRREYSTDLPAILMQRQHLSSILVNLLQNAREALNGSGEIHLTTCYGEHDSIVISIADNGPGIPPDKIDKIFEAYFTTRVKGTGLGLAIVKHNTEMYGGAVRVQSEPGEGYLFHPGIPGAHYDEVDHMSVAHPPILVVDDERNMRLSLRSILVGEGYDVQMVESAEEAVMALEKQEFLMVITDARLGKMSGYEFLAQSCKRWPHIPFLMITAYATPKLAVEAIKAGAIDYLAKPFAPEELLHAVSRCAERHGLIRENASLRAHAAEVYQLEHIVGESPRILELRQLIQSVAPTDATVLILGESGTGKELIAGALHSLSKRHLKNYIRINCAAIPENLLESELFGHEKGAFTGAIRQKLGRVEEADGGTIFLDEIGDMSRSLQAKLLRFLEDGSFTRVGGNDELRVNVRLIAATNRDIIEAIRQNNFREDLFHRLNVVQFRPPPLRERGGDIIILAENFLRHYNGFMNKHIRSLAPASRQKLLGHHWPGNVRELRNVIERAVILETTQEIEPGSLPDFHLEGRLRKTEMIPITGAHSLDELMAEFERQLIQNTLEQNRYNLSKTSEQLKISRHALRYRMQRLNINLDADDEQGPASGRDAAA